MVKTAILIPTYNNFEVLKISLQRLGSITDKKNFDIFVIDNGSTDKTKDVVGKLSKIKYLKLDKNYLASRALDIGFDKFKIAKSYKYLLIMAHDVLVDHSTPSELVKFLEANPDIGMAGAKHYEYGTEILRTTGHSINNLTSMLINFVDEPRSGQLNHFSSMYMIPTKIYEQINGLDYVLYPMIFEEPDIGERIKRIGFKIKCCKNASIWHPIELSKKSEKKINVRLSRIHSTMAKSYLFFRNRLIYMSKYAGIKRFFVFFFLVHPFIILYYFKSLNRSFFPAAIQGLVDGIIFAATKDRDYIERQNRNVLKI